MDSVSKTKAIKNQEPDRVGTNLDAVVDWRIVAYLF